MGSGVRAGGGEADRTADGLDEFDRHEVAGEVDEAIAYATRNGIPYRVEEPKKPTRKVVSYSDNFKYNRTVPWSH
jgi:hypothetical protein